ncbi:hypothetical protein AKO1_011029 [Acrasis kona]|uniref:Uncharacterized protein n=1 Tax=Acrasis kona TaxID=1008807 RepID=A0AAW2YSQ6_9EUKA
MDDVTMEGSDLFENEIYSQTSVTSDQDTTTPNSLAHLYFPITFNKKTNQNDAATSRFLQYQFIRRPPQTNSTQYDCIPSQFSIDKIVQELSEHKPIFVDNLSEFKDTKQEESGKESLTKLM